MTEAPDEHVVQPAAFAVHRDANARLVSTSVTSTLVNWLPWSLLKISGGPSRSSASCNASTQKLASSVLDRRQDSPVRLAQSIADALCGVGTPRSLQGCATMLLETLYGPSFGSLKCSGQSSRPFVYLRRVSATDSRIVTIVDYTCLSGPFSPRAARPLEANTKSSCRVTVADMRRCVRYAGTLRLVRGSSLWPHWVGWLMTPNGPLSLFPGRSFRGLFRSRPLSSGVTKNMAQQSTPFPFVDLDQLLAHPKARKREDLGRILQSPQSEDWLTWNVLRAIQHRASWWPALVSLAKGQALELDDSVASWQISDR